MGSKATKPEDNSGESATRSPQVERENAEQDNNAAGTIDAMGCQTAQQGNWQLNFKFGLDCELGLGPKRVEEERRSKERQEQNYRAMEDGARREHKEQDRKATEGRAGPKGEEAVAWQACKQHHVGEEKEDTGGNAQAPSLPVRLPEVCHRHNSRQGCKDTACRRLHICKLFLADICKYGVGCRFGHSLTTVHNEVVCSTYDLNTRQELVLIQKLRNAFEENSQLPDTVYFNNLETCFRFGSVNPCEGDLCNRIHICRYFVAGNCGRALCKFGHDLHTTHNNGVLSRHKATKMSDDEIMNLLRQNQPTWTIKGTGDTAARSDQNGDVPRQQSRGTSGHVQQTGGLSEELVCPVCLEMFNRATTLGCGHTFCAGCLYNVRLQGGDDKCPTCRTRITSLTRSFTLDNIVMKNADE